MNNKDKRFSIPNGWNEHKRKDRIHSRHKVAGEQQVNHRICRRTQSRSTRCNEGIITKTTDITLTDHKEKREEGEGEEGNREGGGEEKRRRGCEEKRRRER